MQIDGVGAVGQWRFGTGQGEHCDVGGYPAVQRDDRSGQIEIVVSPPTTSSESAAIHEGRLDVVAQLLAILIRIDS